MLAIVLQVYGKSLISTDLLICVRLAVVERCKLCFAKTNTRSYIESNQNVNS
jgi:hypothetical protein